MQKIAIIGSGISGLAVSYLLKDDFKITLYEKNNYYGGHSRTLKVKNDIAIDTGFIVFNHHTYYHLTRFFKHLNVPTTKSKMSFGISIRNGEFEYGSNGLKSLSTQIANLFKPRYYKMIIDIFRFNKISQEHLDKNTLDENITLAEYLEKIKVGDWFKQYYLLAMGACIWSTAVKKMYDFPALSFIRFFSNHGLLTTKKPIQWYTVQGGSEIYVNKIIDQLKKSNIKFAPMATEVIRNPKVKILDSQQQSREFDKVIFACHSNEVLALIKDLNVDEKNIISAIKYQANIAVLHTDENMMPKRKNAWSSWNYLSIKAKDNRKVVSLSYWMNNLQLLNTNKNFFVTINPDQRLRKSKIIDEHIFEHPVFDKAAISAQRKFEKIQGINNAFYCGAYLRYGFHEDGIFSAVNVVKKLGVKTPW